MQRSSGKEGRKGSVINFNAVSINHSDTNTHYKRAFAVQGHCTRGIESGGRGSKATRLKGAHLEVATASDLRKLWSHVLQSRRE